MYSFRPAVQSDGEFLYAMMEKNMADYFQRFTTEGWSRERFDEGFKPERITVCEDGKNIVAFYDIDSMGADTVYLRNIQVERGTKPVGSLLLERIEQAAREAGKKSIRAKVFKSNPAFRLAQRHGFEILADIDEECSYWIEKVIS